MNKNELSNGTWTDSILHHFCHGCNPLRGGVYGMTYRIDELEQLTTRAHIASELRLLGFSEHAIKNISQLTEEQAEEVVKKYKDACDLMGDAEE